MTFKYLVNVDWGVTLPGVEVGGHEDLESELEVADELRHRDHLRHLGHGRLAQVEVDQTIDFLKYYCNRYFKQIFVTVFAS